MLVRLTRGSHKGRLICLFRTGRENPIYQCDSDDEGRTWTRAYPLSWQYSRYGRRRDIVGTDPDVIEMQDGTLVMSFGHKPDFRDDGNFLAFSTDQGQSWTGQPTLIHNDCSVNRYTGSGTRRTICGVFREIAGRPGLRYGGPLSPCESFVIGH